MLQTLTSPDKELAASFGMSSQHSFWDPAMKAHTLTNAAIVPAADAACRSCLVHRAQVQLLEGIQAELTPWNLDAAQQVAAAAASSSYAASRASHIENS